MDLQERAASLSSFLTLNTREGERRIVVKTDDAPEWVADLIRVVHGDLFPDDWTYQAIRDAAAAIEEDGEDAAIEPDIYTSDLLAWLKDYPGAADFCDQAREEYGFSGGIIEQIGYGQSLALREIVAAVIAQLEYLAEEEELGDDTDEDDEGA